MYNRLKRLYLDGKLTDVGLDNAVLSKLLTQEQADEIKVSKTV